MQAYKRKGVQLCIEKNKDHRSWGQRSREYLKWTQTFAEIKAY